MVDITKEEFWENKYEEVLKPKKEDNKIKEFIFNHKITTTLLVFLSLLIIVNISLIYYFLEVIMTM